MTLKGNYGREEAAIELQPGLLTGRSKGQINLNGLHPMLLRIWQTSFRMATKLRFSPLNSSGTHITRTAVGIIIATTHRHGPDEV